MELDLNLGQLGRKIRWHCVRPVVTFDTVTEVKNGNCLSWHDDPRFAGCFSLADHLLSHGLAFPFSVIGLKRMSQNGKTYPCNK